MSDEVSGVGHMLCQFAVPWGTIGLQYHIPNHRKDLQEEWYWLLTDGLANSNSDSRGSTETAVWGYTYPIICPFLWLDYTSSISSRQVSACLP